MPDVLTELTRLDPIATPITVRRASLDQLRDGVLASPRHHARRWLAPLAAAAAVLVAVVLFWQSSGAPIVVPTAPLATPSATIPSDTWVTTAPSPLSPRHSSVSVWADGSFFLIGGTSAAVCPATSFCVASTGLRDGARYDPRADAWTPIADAPEDVIGYPLTSLEHAAVLGRTIYLLGPTSFLAYDLDADQWQRLPFPPGGQVIGFGATGSSVVAVVARDDHPGEANYATWRQDRAFWILYAVEGKVRGSATSATVAGGRLVLTSLTSSSPTSNWAVDIVDPTTAEMRHPDNAPIETSVLAAIGLDTGEDAYAVWRGQQKAWFLNLRTDTWSSVDLPTTDGSFVGVSAGNTTYWPVTVSGLVEVRGHLYNPVTGRWATTPAIPTGADSPVITSGPDLVLACFGYTPATSTFAGNCYLLRPGAATLSHP